MPPAWDHLDNEGAGLGCAQSAWGEKLGSAKLPAKAQQATVRAPLPVRTEQHLTGREKGGHSRHFSGACV